MLPRKLGETVDYICLQIKAAEETLILKMYRCNYEFLLLKIYKVRCRVR